MEKIVFSLVCVYVLNFKGTASLDSTSIFRFKRYMSNDLRIVLPGKSLQVKSATSCAMKALTRSSVIKSFIYNNKTRQCYPEVELSATGRLQAPEENPYLNSVCDYQKGFHLISYNTTTACIGFFNETLNYTNAVRSCKEKQSFLMSIKTIDKLEILRQEVPSTLIDAWIGLNDMDMEGSFTWIEDSSLLDGSLKGQIFKANEPNDGSSNEDCVEYKHPDRLLNDDTCSDKSPYVCEQTILY